MSAGDGSCGRDSCGCADDSVAAPAQAEASILDRLENDSGFHPMGDEWEAEMREMLDDTEYDTELGMQMAQDAMRLVAGEMSEEEFYGQYHDAVVEEFETDDRPMAERFELEDGDEPGGSLRESIAELADTDVSRRETMKKMGLGAGALGLGGMVPNEEVDHAGHEEGHGPQDELGDGKQYGMVIDLERCDGCLECVIGCMDENRTTTGANWMYVMTWEDEITDQENMLVRPCQHCSNAPCVKVCPVQARHRREDGGLVLTNYETCIGCRYCQVACPYGVNYFEWGEPDVPHEELETVDYTAPELRDMPAEERHEVLRDSGDGVHDHRGWEVDMRGRRGTMGKCTFCPSWQDGNKGEERIGSVACMEACDTAGMSAIHFGDLNDENSRPNRYLERRTDQAFERDTELEDEEGAEYESTVTPWGKLSAFHLLEDIGTQPNVIYLGNEPGPNAHQVDGPVSYNDVESRVDGRDIVDRRKDVTDKGTDLGMLGGRDE